MNPDDLPDDDSDVIAGMQTLATLRELEAIEESMTRTRGV